jgi:predicted phage-related endonuclease
VTAPVPPDATFRASHVGASEVAALFDASPWVTKFELFHRKRGTIATPEFNEVVDGKPADMRVFCGVMLEPVVIDIACRLWGYERVETPKKLTNGRGLGGHPDQLVRCPERGVGVLEVKTADWLVAKGWGDEPPLHYQLQAQTYAGLAGVEWCEIVTLVSGNDPRRFALPFKPKLYAEIEARVAAFWADVKAGRAPPVDYARDAATLVEAIGSPDDTVADLRDNLDAEQDAIDFLAGKALRDEGEARMDAAKCRLIERIGTAGRAILPGHKIGCNRTKDTPDREAKPGEIIKGRRGYRRFDLKSVEN